MSFFNSKSKRRQKYETDVTYQQNSSRGNKQVTIRTTPDYQGSEFMTSTGDASDQLKHLNSYINELVKENERLQNIVDDARTTNQLSKQMLNDYVNTINEQSEEIQALKNENFKLVSELNAYKKKIRRRNEANLDGTESKSNSIPNNSFATSENNRNSEIFNAVSSTDNSEEKYQNLLKELNKLKSEIQRFTPQSDDEPEDTQNRQSKIGSKEILSCLVDENSDNEENADKLQQLLDS